MSIYIYIYLVMELDWVCKFQEAKCCDKDIKKNKVNITVHSQCCFENFQSYKLIVSVGLNDDRS